MAQPTGTFDKYDAVGIREALSDVIYNISPEETPFMSNAGRESTKNTTFEWQTDALAAASSSNHHIEGDDISTFDSVTPTVRLNNYTQISRKTLVISGTLEATDRAGRKSEMTYQAAKQSAEIKRDMETAALSNRPKVAGDSSTARQTAGLGAWVATNTDVGATGTDPSPVDGSDARGDGTQRAFTETILKSVVSQMWAEGAKTKMLMLGAFNKQAASAFTGIALNRKEAKGASPITILGAADVYVSDFGNLSIVPNRFQRARDGWFIDPEYVSFVYLRPFFVKKLADTGDSEKRALYVEWGLKVKQEKALGLAADLNTA